MIIQYFILQVFGEQLEKAMLQLLLAKEADIWLMAKQNDQREEEVPKEVVCKAGLASAPACQIYELVRLSILYCMTMAWIKEWSP